MNKMKLYLGISTLIGFLATLFYNRVPTGHGMHAAVPPRIMVGIFIFSVWYIALYFFEKLRFGRRTNTRIISMIGVLLIAFAISVWAFFYPSEFIYWA